MMKSAKKGKKEKNTIEMSKKWKKVRLSENFVINLHRFLKLKKILFYY